jgi:hypothetical protein
MAITSDPGRAGGPRRCLLDDFFGIMQNVVGLLFFFFSIVNVDDF